jgi:hypothetical protein
MSRPPAPLDFDPGRAAAFAISCVLVFIIVALSRANTDNAQLPPLALPEFAKQIQVKVHNKTIALADVAAQSLADPRQKKYRELREATADSPDANRDLALWCRKQHFTEEEQLHWRLWLRQHPGDTEAIKALHLKNYRGLLLTNEQIEEAKKQQEKIDAAAREWTPKLKRLKQAIEHGDADERQAALVELRAINDPAVIPSLEEVFSVETGIGVEVVKTLAKMPGDEAAALLARFAVASPNDSAREAATEALRDQPYEKYVPMLIPHLAAPIEMGVETSVLPGWQEYKKVEWREYTGGVSWSLPHQFRLRSKYVPSDGWLWKLDTTRKSGVMLTADIPNRLQHNYVLTRESEDPKRPYEKAGAIIENPRDKKSKKGNESIDDIKERVKRANAKQAELNRKIHNALNAATGANIPPEKPGSSEFEDVKPKLWWNWWRARSRTDRYFSKGTKVWTPDGPVPIEKILVGDRVLTRDLATRDLTFELVMCTDTQPGSTMRGTTVGTKLFASTGEQQFFTADKGWQKAADLTAGQKLETLTGPQPIAATADAGASEQFGIIVDGVPTFFIGDAGVLVHDATPLQ